MSYSTIIAITNGNVAASTPVALQNPFSNDPAGIPAGAAVQHVAVGRDMSALLTAGCKIQLGTTGNAAQYIAGVDNIVSDDINTGAVVHKNLPIDFGAADDLELRLVLDNDLTQSAMYFFITYVQNI